MNKIQTKIHNNIDRIKGLRGTVTSPQRKSDFVILFIILSFVILPFVVMSI